MEEEKKGRKVEGRKREEREGKNERNLKKKKGEGRNKTKATSRFPIYF